LFWVGRDVDLPPGIVFFCRSAMVPFHTFLWKIASRCNLDCTYCYVYHGADERWRLQLNFMSEVTATQAASRVLEHCRKHNKTAASIVFHGGEPLLGGVAHLEMLTSVIRRTFEHSGIRLSVGMQSNGILLN